MADYTTFTLIEPLRWDQVAYRAYGDVTKLPELLAANSDVPIYDVIPAGTILQVPILDQADADESLLPPWKRDD